MSPARRSLNHGLFFAVVQGHPEGVTVSEVAAEVGCSSNPARLYLEGLWRGGHIQRKQVPGCLPNGHTMLYLPWEGDK